MLTARRADWSDVFASFARMGVADGVAIHHAASAAIPASYDPQYLRNIEHGELAAGYNALAYHRIPFASGEIAESRPNFAMGAATGGHNEHTFAYCVPGYMHPPYMHHVTDAQVLAIALDIQEQRAAGVLTADCLIRPHAWWTAGTQWATACCGETFIPRVAEIEAIANGAPLSSPTTRAKGYDMILRDDGAQIFHLFCMQTGWLQPISGADALELIGSGMAHLDMPAAYHQEWATNAAAAARVVNGGTIVSGGSGVSLTQVRTAVREELDATRLAPR